MTTWTSTPQRTLPSSTRRVVAVMYVGLALTMIAVLVLLVDQATADTLSSHLRGTYAGYVPWVEQDTAGIVIYLLAVGALGVASWLWMVWAVKRQKRWARVAATLAFLLACGDALVNLTIGEYGTTILPTWLGVVGALPCVAGLVAVLLLWTRGRVLVPA